MDKRPWEHGEHGCQPSSSTSTMGRCGSLWEHDAHFVLAKEEWKPLCRRC